MKCPRCGRENSDANRFCIYCSAPLGAQGQSTDGGNIIRDPSNGGVPPIKKRPSAGNIIRALVFTLVLFAVMMLSQSCVISGYTASVMMSDPTLAASLADETTYVDAMTLILERVNEKTALIMLIANALTLLLIFLWFRLRKRDPRSEVSLSRINMLRIPTFAVFGMALNVFVSVTVSIIPLPDSIVEAFENQYSAFYFTSDVRYLVTEIISTALVAGFVEEIVFRGAPMKRLIPAVGRIPALIITSAVFAVAHGTPIAIGYAFVLGLLFGGIYLRYNSIVPTVICHIFFNLTSYIISAAPDGTVLWLYIISIAVIILLSYRIFVRYPVFSDIVCDTDHVIKPINAEELDIRGRLEKMREENDTDPDEILALTEEWEENQRRASEENKKNRRSKRKDKHDTDK